MSNFTVPTVDISPYVVGGTAAEKAAVAAQVDHACRTVGFIQILGHGIPLSVIDDLGLALDSFFALDLEEKKAYVRPASENRGYSPPKSESLSYSAGVDPITRMNDFFEAFNIGSTSVDEPGEDSGAAHHAPNTWPSIDGDDDLFRTRVETYFAHARSAAHALTRAFADALSVEPGYFEQLTDRSIDVLRMNNYALPPGEVELQADLTGMGEHTDFGIVTVLWADQVRGLQVLGTDGTWHDVEPADGAMLVNLGDAMARLTNDQWMSTLHRVKPPVIDGTIKRRRSAAFFHDGNADAIIAPIGHFVTEHDQRYEPVTNAEHIRAKLDGSRAGIKNLHAAREAARVAASSL